MRLLYLMTEPFGVGGVQSDILTLTEDLSKRGHTVYVATTPGVLLDELKGKGARHVNVDFNYRGPAGLARAVAALQRVVREEAIELVAPQLDALHDRRPGPPSACCPPARGSPRPAGGCRSSPPSTTSTTLPISGTPATSCSAAATT